jgi:hypothetical protein
MATTASDLSRAILDEHEQYLATLAGLNRDQLEHQPVLGNWPVRDLTAHLTGWIDALLASAAFGLGGPAPQHEQISDFDAFNAANVAAARRKNWPEIIAGLDAAVERASGWVATLSADQLATEMDFPWGQRGEIGRLLAIIPHHHHEHREDIERWLAARDR